MPLVQNREMASATYTNPVYPGYFADPFVAKFGDSYYAYGTGSVVDGRVFEVLRSPDLVSWSAVGGALEPHEDPRSTNCWAPEVAESEGTFFMYYSCGVEDVEQRLRVATADDPEGPFRDQGRVFAEDRFTIDGHPFRDDDGQWYLYFAYDILEGDRVGTSVGVDRLVDMTTVAGEARTVFRPTAEWQIFKRQRQIYGSVYDWYTVEGPFVVKRAGRYYCFYSGGAWEEDAYGVSYGYADSPLGPFTEPEADGPTVLQAIPERVIGPGHVSIVEGPDGNDYIAYHAWDADKTARRMCIDRLSWGADGPQRVTSTFTPQPAPIARRVPSPRTFGEGRARRATAG